MLGGYSERKKLSLLYNDGRVFAVYQTINLDIMEEGPFRTGVIVVGASPFV